MSDAAAAPSRRETTIAWIAYGLHAIGLFVPFMFWPGVAGLIINYVKRGDDPSGLLNSHHRWMIRTFWWGLAGYAAGFAVMIASATPAIVAAWHAQEGQIHLDWSALLSLIAAASFGVAILIAVWFWLIYRIARGALRLNNAQRVL